jgi:NADH-quinone oxidoreductase subunit L
MEGHYDGLTNLAALIPLLPLAGFLYIILFGKGMAKKLVGWIASGAVLGAFILSAVMFSTQLHGVASEVNLFNWIVAGDLQVSMGFIVDPLSTIYLLFITGIGFLIHVYSIGYMHDDEGFNRFMAYLNLFVFFMLILVLGNSYLLMFAGWEGVGLCSFMLIGFWYKDMANNDAARKAFVMNRIGDLGFVLAMGLMFFHAQSLNYGDLYTSGGIAALDGPTATAVAVLLFIGAMGKSAQIPLHTWLPDAMAGPTPVSALIHAATMVTAGIYLVARSSELFSASEVAGQLVVWIGAATAILGATIALAQNDIKKVLAYSTVSQLGLMFVALGLGAYSIAVFHVITHACFKALLFLGSGSVIHAMGGEQDIRSMGGLKKHLPVTHLTFLIGCLAIAGIIPLAGFFSKDQIIAAAFELNPVAFVISILVSLLTAFYMFRLYYLTFHGSFRGTHEQEHHLHESPRVMTTPLIVLAGLSAVAGFIGFPHSLGHSMNVSHWLDHFLEDMNAGTMVMHGDMPLMTEIILMLLATVIAVSGILMARQIYVVKGEVALEDDEVKNPTHKLLRGKYWIDEIYDAIIRRPVDALSSWLSGTAEPKLVDGLVNSSGRAARWAGEGIRLLHNGRLVIYALMMVLGLVMMLVALL